MPECALEAYVADALGLNPLEVTELDWGAAALHLAYREGKAIAEWAHEHPGGRRRSGRGQPEDSAVGD